MSHLSRKFRGKRGSFPCPNLMTDSVFMQGTQGATKFMPSLCRPGVPNDPEAHVSSRADVKRVCEKNGWGCTGSVNVKPVVLDEPAGLEKPYEVADDAVHENIAEQELDAGEPFSKQVREDKFHDLKVSMSGNQP